MRVMPGRTRGSDELAGRGGVGNGYRGDDVASPFGGCARGTRRVVSLGVSRCVTTSQPADLRVCPVGQRKIPISCGPQVSAPADVTLTLGPD